MQTFQIGQIEKRVIAGWTVNVGELFVAGKNSVTSHWATIGAAEIIQSQRKPGDQESAPLWTSLNLNVDRRIGETFLALF